MARSYKRNGGGRCDGRRIRSMSGFFNFIPFIMPNRSDALVYFDQAFEVSGVERWFRKQRAASGTFLLNPQPSFPIHGVPQTVGFPSSRRRIGLSPLTI